MKKYLSIYTLLALYYNLVFSLKKKYSTNHLPTELQPM